MIQNEWDRLSPLEFQHKTFGQLYRNHFSEWEQVHPEFGKRVLKSDMLREAFEEAETPYPIKKEKKHRVAREGKVARKTKSKKSSKPAKSGKKKVTKRSKVASS